MFAPLGTPAWYWLFASRVLGIPLVAGIAFEIIKLFGKNRSKRWAQIADVARHAAPEAHHPRARPDQLAVAIAALEAVLAVENPEDADGRGPGRDGGRRLAYESQSQSASGPPSGGPQSATPRLPSDA